MARPIWTGALSFGLVNVPVGVYSATDDKTVHFNQLERGTSDRVRNKRVNERTGEEVAFDAIVKGYDLGGGRFVVIEPEEAIRSIGVHEVAVRLHPEVEFRVTVEVVPAG